MGLGDSSITLFPMDGILVGENKPLPASYLKPEEGVTSGSKIY